MAGLESAQKVSMNSVSPWEIWGYIPLKQAITGVFLIDTSGFFGLIIPWSQVRVLLGPPNKKAARCAVFVHLAFHSSGQFTQRRRRQKT